MQKFKSIEEKNVLRAVLDTNIIISGILNPKGPSGKILFFLAEQESFDLLISREIFLEYFEVLHRKKFGLSKTKIDYTLKLISEQALIISPKQKLEAALDSDDNKFLECALEGKASFVVTGNKKHYPFLEFQGIRIASPSEFLSFLGL